MEKPDYLCQIPFSLEETGCLCGVVLHLDRSRNQFHCGLAYRLEDGQINILHLATHNNLECDSEWKRFEFFILPHIDVMRQRAFIPLCKLISKRLKEEQTKVTYGLRFDDYAEYDEEGILHLGEHKIGLTCATYVLTLFHSIGLDLINLKDWPDREEDHKWQEDIVGDFKDYKTHPKIQMTKEYLEMLKEEAKEHPHRYRPEEVAAGSALYNRGAAPSNVIIENGKCINEFIYQNS